MQCNRKASDTRPCNCGSVRPSEAAAIAVARGLAAEGPGSVCVCWTQPYRDRDGDDHSSEPVIWLSSNLPAFAPYRRDGVLVAREPWQHGREVTVVQFS